MILSRCTNCDAGLGTLRRPFTAPRFTEPFMTLGAAEPPNQAGRATLVVAGVLSVFFIGMGLLSRGR